MKKIKLVLMTLAVIIGITGALANKTAHSDYGKKLVVYNWQACDASGNVIIGGAYYGSASRPQAQTYFGCSGTGAYCATTVTGKDGSKLTNPTYINKKDIIAKNSW